MKAWIYGLPEFTKLMVDEIDDGAGTTTTYKGIAEYGNAEGWFRTSADTAKPIWIMKKIVVIDDGAWNTTTENFSADGKPHTKQIRDDRLTLNRL